MLLSEIETQRILTIPCSTLPSKSCVIPPKLGRNCEMSTSTGRYEATRGVAAHTCAHRN